MKKIFSMACVLLMCGAMSSCYNVKVANGDITSKTPVVKVNSEWNHHFLFGLIAGKNAKMESKDYVEGAENYVVKTNQSFVNGLVSLITFGIYTPTTTTYYMPVNAMVKK